MKVLAVDEGAVVGLGPADEVGDVGGDKRDDLCGEAGGLGGEVAVQAFDAGRRCRRACVFSIKRR